MSNLETTVFPARTIKPELENSYKSVHSCDVCSYSTKSIFFMTEHVKQHLEADCPQLFSCTTPPDTYSCKSCRFHTYLTVTFNKHIVDRHQINQRKLQRVKLTNHICESCKFETYSKLRWFLHTQMGCRRPNCAPKLRKKFECEKCHFRSKFSHKLQEHETVKHGRRAPKVQYYECHQCSLKTKFKNNLYKHMKLRHTDPKAMNWYKCDQCGFKAKQKSNINSHKIWKHLAPEEIEWFQCDKCPYKAKKSFTLKTHVVAKHTAPEDIKWFKCDKCAFKSKRKCNLQVHLEGMHPNGGALRKCTRKKKRRGRGKRADKDSSSGDE